MLALAVDTVAVDPTEAGVVRTAQAAVLPVADVGVVAAIVVLAAGDSAGAVDWGKDGEECEGDDEGADAALDPPVVPVAAGDLKAEDLLPSAVLPP